MMQDIGWILIVYAVIAIIILIVLHKQFIKFLDRLLSKTKIVLASGRDLLLPVKAAALSTRSGAEHIDEVIQSIEQTIPPLITSAAGDLNAIITAIKDVPRHISEFIHDASTELNATLITVTDVIHFLTTDVIPKATKPLLESSSDLYQPLFWLTDEALAALINDDHVPIETVDKLLPIVDQWYKTEDDLRKEVEDKLSAEEFTQYIDTIVSRGRNSNSHKGTVATFEEARSTLYQIGDETLQDVADSVLDAKNSITALLVLTDIAAGPFAPLAAVIRSHCDVFLTLFKDLGDRLKITSGQFGKLPSPPLTIPSIEIPEGALFGMDYTIAGFDFSVVVPDRNYPLLKGVDAGQWGTFKFPSHDIKLFDGRGLVASVKDIRGRANDLITAVRSSRVNDVRDKLQATADKLRVTADNLVHLAEDEDRLHAQIETIRKLARTCFEQALKLDIVAEKLEETLTRIQQHVADSLFKIDTFANNILRVISKVLMELGDLTKSIQDFSLKELLGNLQELSGDIESLANSIDDGRPIHTPGKTDMVQYLTNVFEAVEDALPPRKQIMQIVNCAFGFLVAVHTAFLFIGIYMVRSS
ncbi:hypothetical protein [Paenibacillus sp. SER-28]